MERKIRRSQELDVMESYVHRFIVDWRSEKGGPPGNKAIASALDISRNEAGRIRSRMRIKLGLPAGF